MSVTPTILSTGNPMDPTFQLLSLTVEKEVNRIPSARIVLLDGDTAQQNFAISDDAFFEPGKPIEIKLRYEERAAHDVTVFKGIVIRQTVEADRHGSLLTVDLKDTAIKLTLTRRSALFADKMTDDKIIGGIIDDSGLTKGKIPTAKIQHEQLIQYNCTDWDFILSRADSLGWVVVANDGEISMAELTIAGGPKQTFEFGIDPIFRFEMETDSSNQYASVQTVAWDIKTQALTAEAKAADVSLQQGNLKGSAVAKSVGAPAYTQTDPVPLDANERQAWSDATLARSRWSMLRGTISVEGVATIQLMDAIKVDGVGKRFDGTTLVTGIRHQVDDQGWVTAVQFGLPAARFAEHPNIIAPPAAGLLPAINGLHIGLVDEFAEDPDGEFRVKVNLPGVDVANAIVWARLATPDAGNGRGYFFRPEPGDEVVVGFFNGDPRQAVILGAMYSSKNIPPQMVSQLEKDNKHKAIVTRKGTSISFLDDEQSSLTIETPAANKIILDDEAQTIQLMDQQGNTITMGQKGIEIKSDKDIKINAGGAVEIKSGKDLTLDAGGNVTIKGTAVDVK